MNTVLVVDDDDSNRQLLNIALQQEFEIYEAATGQAALDCMDEAVFQLALIDIELPDVNGVDLARELRAQNPDVFIIMSTATDNPTMLQRACQAGANIYLVKPYDLSRVMSLIHDLTPQSAIMRVIYQTRETEFNC